MPQIEQIEPSGPLRLFVAVPVRPTPLLCEFLDRLRRLGKAVKVPRSTHLHLTLKFLGDVTDDRLVPVFEAVTAAAQSASPIEFQIHGLRAFPRWERPNVVYTPILERVRGREVFATLANELERLCEPLGFARERRPFAPHVTLARIKYRPPPQMAKLMQEWAGANFGFQQASELVLFRSELRRSGPTYTRILTAPLDS